MSTLTEASHQVHAGVDDPPRQIAAERGNQQGAHLHIIRSRYTDGTRIRQRHYQAEENFGAVQQVRVRAQTAAWNPPRTYIGLQGSTGGITENRSFDEPFGEMC